MPHLPFYISRRYLFAKKSHNAINIITAISVVVVAVGTLAMILILSVFNGLEDLIASLYNSVEPDIEISPVKGKYIDLESFPLDKLKKDPSIAYYSEVIEDMALAKYTPVDGGGNERQLIVKLKAVRSDYRKMSGIDTMVFEGQFLLKYKANNFAVAGNGVASKLGLRLNNYETPIYFYFPRADASDLNPMDAFNIEQAYPSGVISVQQEVDEQLIYVSLDFAEKLMNLKNKATSIEVLAKQNTDIISLKSKLDKILGKDYKLKDRRQQNEMIYKITQSEKWSGFLILSFILLIAIFNVVGSVTVLILEKKEDIETFSNLGFTGKLIRKIFLWEGMMISIVGGAAGLFLGVIIIILQQKFGLIPMEGSFAVSSFPVAMKFTDFLAVFAMVISIGFLATILPVKRISKSILNK